MNHLFRLIVLTLGGLIANMGIAASLSSDAQERGINPTCLKYLEQIEVTNQLTGLTLTSIYNSNPSLNPSLHIRASKLKNAVSLFSTTLSPDGEFCYVSVTATTLSKVNSCKEITETRLIENPNLKVTYYADGDYTLISRENDNYSVILIDVSESSCFMTETQMQWPGK